MKRTLPYVITLLMFSYIQLFSQSLNQFEGSLKKLPFAAKAASNGFLLKNRNFYNWDATSSSWIWHNTDTYTYDSKNNLIEWDTQGNVIYRYSYNINNQLISDSNQYYTGVGWQNNTRHFYTYDSRGNITDTLSQSYNLLDSTWVNAENVSNTYDDNNNIVTQVVQDWSDTAWVNNYKETRTYDSNNKMSGKLIQNWDGNQWVNYENFLYYYNSNNNLNKKIDQDWSNNNWLDANIYIYTYSNSLLTGKLATHNNGGIAWVNEDTAIFIYDGNNNLTEYIDIGWDLNDSKWWSTPTYLDKYTYDADNNLIESLYQDNLINTSKIVCTWSAITTAVNTENISPKHFTLSQNYPNPFNPSTEISYGIPKPGIVKLSLYNSLGQKLAELVNKYQEAGKHSINFNGKNLASGIYYYRLQSGSFIQTKKMVYLK